MAVDRRATIAAAMDAAEENKGELPENFTPPVDPDEGDEGEEPLAPQETPDEEGEGEELPSEPVSHPDQEKSKQKVEAKAVEDKPPQSWRVAQKAKWAGLDPDIRQEILRRERDHERILSESSSARQISGALAQVVQPFMARIQSFGVHPLVAFQELLKADYLLHNGPMSQRASMMAKLINDYSIDVVELDKALSGNASNVNPVEAQVAQMLEERLQPLRQFLDTQSQNEQQRRQQETQVVDSTVEQMAADNVKYPHFDAVRADMADIIEIQAKRGVYLNLEQAYNRAVGMNPEVSQLVAKQQDKGRLQTQHARAQRALSASMSVNGSPGGTPGGGQVNTKDRRATIAAAFDALEGR